MGTLTNPYGALLQVTFLSQKAMRVGCQGESNNTRKDWSYKETTASSDTFTLITWDSNASFCKHAKQQVPKRDRILLIYTIPVWVHIESLNPPLGARCSICAWLTWIFNFDFRLSDCCCDFRFPHIYTFALPAKVNKNSWEMICKQRDAHGAFYCPRQVALLEAAAPFFIHCRAKSRSPSISASTCLNLSWLATLSVNPAMKIPYEDWSDIDTCLGRRL